MGWSCDGRPWPGLAGSSQAPPLARPQHSLPALTSLIATAGYSLSTCYTLSQLVSACYSLSQLVTACYSRLQVMTCCLSLLTVCVGRVAGVWVGGVHAGVTRHMSLVCSICCVSSATLCSSHSRPGLCRTDGMVEARRPAHPPPPAQHPA